MTDVNVEVLKVDVEHMKTDIVEVKATQRNKLLLCYL